MRKHTTVLIIAAAFALGGLVSAFALLAPKRSGGSPASLHSPWQEVRWPFPMDQWGTGKAFHCNAADCGTEVTIYLRAKIGFCNCSDGLITDDELDRVSDFDLFGGTLYPQTAGRPLKAAWLKGRSRPFAIRDALGRDRTMISAGLHDNCDALVATAVLPRGALSTAEPAVQQFLDSNTFADWARTTLGL
jgi:hypothetical protein